MGLVPNWANDPKSDPRPVNPRAETVRWKFGDLFRERRCLLPADGIYEWKTEGKKKFPWRFTLASGEPFAFAGLWDVWRSEGQMLRTSWLITTTANEMVSEVHDRMPVVLAPENYSTWLDPETPESDLMALPRPYPAERMRAATANPVLNSPKNDGPECLEAA